MLLLFSFSGHSQKLPKKGAILVIEEKSFNITSHEVTTAEIELVRSKINRKTKFGGLSAGTPEGITINFEKDEINNNLYIMTISADESAKKDAYTIIIKGKGDNSSKIRGTAIKVTLDENQMVTANQ